MRWAHVMLRALLRRLVAPVPPIDDACVVCACPRATCACPFGFVEPESAIQPTPATRPGDSRRESLVPGPPVDPATAPTIPGRLAPKDRQR